MTARAEPARSPRDTAESIVRTLRERSHIAYFAGGCVRDELLGATPEDYDVATDAHPEVVRGLFRNVTEVGAAFGVMLVRIGRVTVEVATFREEGPYSDRRRPDQVRYADAERDARRRDFTVNALFLDPLAPPSSDAAAAVRGGGAVRGKVIDYVGGLDDLRTGVIRSVGDPDTRLNEDNLRALRAARFTARLGFRLDGATAAAVRRHAAELAGVSRERIGHEVRRMFAHPSVVQAASLMEELALAAPALGEPPSRAGTEAGRLAVPTLEGAARARVAEGGASFPALLAAWAIDRLGRPNGDGGPVPASRIGSEADAVLRRLRRALCLTNEERDELAAILRGVTLLELEWGGLGVAGRKRAAASGWFPAAIAIIGARSGNTAEAIAREVEALRMSASGLAPRPFVSGDDLVAAGHSPGPRLGKWLDALYDAQLEGTIRSRAEALKLVEEWAKER